MSTSPVIAQVSPRDIIRDASGRYGCPKCWSTHMGAVRPGDVSCAKCGVQLDWSAVEGARPVVRIRNERVNFGVRIFSDLQCVNCDHRGLIYVAMAGYNGSCDRLVQCPSCGLVQQR